MPDAKTFFLSVTFFLILFDYSDTRWVQFQTTATERVTTIDWFPKAGRSQICSMLKSKCAVGSHVKRTLCIPELKILYCQETLTVN